jgi:hypothetical protein
MAHIVLGETLTSALESASKPAASAHPPTRGRFAGEIVALGSGLESASKPGWQMPASTHPQTRYLFMGETVCATAFSLLQGVSVHRTKKIVSHYRQNGLITRESGLKNRLGNRTRSVEDVEIAWKFLRNWANSHGLPSPGRHCTRDRHRIVYLPTSTKKRDLYDQYASIAMKHEMNPISMTTFKQLWRRYLPHVKIMPLMSDLCSTCKKYHETISTTPAEVTPAKRAEYKEHVDKAKREREVYIETRKRARDDPRLCGKKFSCIV